MPSVSYPSPDAYYNYAANGGPHNYTQQAWGNAPQYTQYPQFTNPNAPPPKNVQGFKDLFRTTTSLSRGLWIRGKVHFHEV